MFPFPYPAPYAAALYALLGLDLLLLGGGLACGPLDADHTGRLPRPLRMALSAILVAAALLQWRLSAGMPAAGYAPCILAGMALGFLGDLIMAKLIPVPNRLIAGMLAFGLGHLAYIAGLAGLTGALGLWHPQLHSGVGLAMALAGLLLWARFVRKPRGAPALNAAALAYTLLMAAMNSLAIALALRQARFLPLAAGALLFLTSDLIIGNWNIRGHAWRRINDAIWLTYNLGQLLIVYSVAAAW